MLKCLMLAKWFNLFDPGLEEALKDGISIHRFVGLSFTGEAPDKTTFVRFRERLREEIIHKTIFSAVVAHIKSQGPLVRAGTMVNATFIEAPRGRKYDDGSNTRVPDESFTKKHGNNYHGYNGHIACDLSGVVMNYRYGAAKEHDSRRIDELTSHDRRVAIADSAYSDRARRASLRARGMTGAIGFKRYRG